MSNQQSQEVQLLLTAEKRSSEKIAEARKRKARRLKQAKEEASAEIEQFKAERQIAFQKYKDQHLNSTGNIEKKIEEETNEKLDTMAKRIDGTRGVILDRLIGEVCSNVDPRLHRNKKAVKT